MSQRAVEKSFCTTREAAELLGVSVGTIQLWVEKGLLEAWKTGGGHRRVVRDSIERLLHKPSTYSGLSAAAGIFPSEVNSGVSANQENPVQPSGATLAAIPLSQRKLKVMVVEDDAALLRLYDTQISRWPMKPEFVGLDNGFAALILLGRHRPDLLILDLHMPEMDGFGMLRVISSTPDLAQTRVVVVTGLDAAEVAARGGLPSAIEVLPKPIPFARLLAIANDICDATGLNQQAASA